MCKNDLKPRSRTWHHSSIENVSQPSQKYFYPTRIHSPSLQSISYYQDMLLNFTFCLLTHLLSFCFIVVRLSLQTYFVLDVTQKLEVLQFQSSFWLFLMVLETNCYLFYYFTRLIIFWSNDVSNFFKLIASFSLTISCVL